MESAERLRGTLEALGERLLGAQWDEAPRDLAEQVAYDRQRRALRGGVSIITRLAAPWLAPQAERAVERACEALLRIHLYARIVDDAVDEGELVHRVQLLRAQRLFWEALRQLHVLPEASSHHDALLTLITCQLSANEEALFLRPHTAGERSLHLLILARIFAPDESTWLQHYEDTMLVLTIEQLSEDLFYANDQ